MEQKKQWVHALIAFFLVVICTAQTAWPWETIEVDGGPVIGPSSLAVDKSDHVHIVYRDESSQGLKHATNATGSWVSTFIEPSLAADNPSVAVDDADNLHIVCDTAEGTKYLSNSSGSWTVTGIRIGSNPSIAIGPSGHVHLCAKSGSIIPPGGWIYYATNRSGNWEVEHFAGNWGFFEFPCGTTSIAVDSGGHVHLRYGTADEIFCGYAEYYATNASGSWVETPLIKLPFGGLGGLKAWSPSLAIDTSDHAHIAYETLIIIDTHLWSFLTHASDTTGRMRSVMVAWQGSEVLPAWTAMATDSENRVHIAYGFDVDGDYTVRINYATNTRGAWVLSGPLSDPIKWSSSPPSIGVDSSGKVYISYIDTDDKRLLVISGMAAGPSPFWPGMPGEAAAYGQTSRVGSSLFNNLEILLVPMGAVLLLRIWRRRR